VTKLTIRNIVAHFACDNLFFHTQDGLTEMIHLPVFLFEQVQDQPEGRFPSDPGKCSEFLYSFFQ
jgi:hypothetical protein